MTYEIVTVSPTIHYQTTQTYTLAHAIARDLAKRTHKRVEIRTHDAAEAVGRYY